MKTRTTALLLFLPFCLIIFSSALAMPPHPDLLKKIRSGEMPEPYYLQHIREIAARGVESPVGSGGLDAPRHHTLDEDLNIIVIFVDFNDHGAHTQPEFFDSLLYGNHSGTVRDYYSQVSYGNLTLVTVNMPSALGWQRAPHSYSYYVDGQNGFGNYPHNAQRLAEDAVALVNPMVDFSQYDNDGDGQVEALFIVHSGPGAEFTGNSNDIWSHKWQMQNPQQVDGVTADIYSMEPEYWNASGDMTCGVYAHEMGHSVFGLPDLYDYDYDSEGLGRWSLMAGGSWNGPLGSIPSNPDAWSRVYMGFVSPTVVSSNQSGVSIPQVEGSPMIYRLWTDGQQGSEYFLVENRQQNAYDRAIPGNGLMIYHVDESVWGNDSQWYPGHTTNGHYSVALEQADGLWSMEQNANSGDVADPYPGAEEIHSFSANSIPSSNDYDLSDTHVSVRHTIASSDTMHASFFVNSTANPVFVFIPDTLVDAGSEIDIPVSVENSLSGLNVMSLQFTVVFDSAIATTAAPYFDRSGGAIPASWTVTPTHTATSLTINATGSSALTGAGRLLWIRLHTSVDAQNNAASLIAFSGFAFNQGIPAADTTNGRIRLLAARILVQPNAIDLGAVRVGSTMIYDALVVRDLGGANLIIDSLGVPGFVTAAFTTPQTLPPNIWTPIHLHFAPTVEQFFSDSVRIYSNTYESPTSLAICGRGAVPRLSCATTEVNFDSVAVGHTVERTISLSDTGYWPTAITGVQISDGSPFQLANAPQWPDTIPARGVRSYVVRFTASLGTSNDNMLIANDAGAMLIIPLVGTGMELNANDPSSVIPTAFGLRGNYPNPFNPSTTLTYDVPRRAWVTLTVYDVLGRAVDVPLSGMMQPGRFSLTWACPNCGSGIYFFVLAAEGQRFTRKAMLLR